MKTRNEMIYDFMLALAPQIFEQMQLMDDYAREEGIPPISIETITDDMHEIASNLADQYLKGIN